MSQHRPRLCVPHLRQCTQLLFLFAFLGLVIWARAHTGTEASPWLKAFFLIDPLLLLATWLTTHVLLPAFLVSLVLVGLTVLMGRVFCGWICPFGTVHALVGWVWDRVWPNKKRRDHWSGWQRAKYYLLAAFLVMAVFGSHWVTVFDPLVLLYRSTVTALMPGAQWAVEESTTPLAQSESETVHAVSKYATEPVYVFLRDNVFGGVDRQHSTFLGGGLILGVFGALLLLNGLRRRFWCRYLCPLGAMLGVLAWRPWLRRQVNPVKCNQCDLCGMACHGAASAAPGDQWKPAECLGCLNCTDNCRRDGLTWTWVWPWRRQPAVEGVDLSKRAALGSIMGGLAALVLLRINPQARGKMVNAGLIRPPGAGPERDFLQRCTACGMCLEVCPTGGLQPALAEAGLEGLWTPHLVPRLGPCEFDCNLCTQVCPTEAIGPLAIEDKRKVRLGLATFDVTRCIPYAFGRNCGVCEECCPIPDKAIYVLEVEVQDRDGQKRTIKQPHVDPAKCIGCGRCENMCPYKDQPGIRVTSANESRNPDNQPILSLDGGDSPY